MTGSGKVSIIKGNKTEAGVHMEGKRTKNTVDGVLLSITFILLLAFGILNKQKFIKLFPSVVSLVVYILSSRANRYAYLLGGLNSLVYAVGFAMEGLYASVCSAVSISFPLQIATFFRWKKRGYKQATEFRKMNIRQEFLLGASALAFWFVLFVFVRQIPSAKQSVFDVAGFVFGIYATVLTVFAYMEALAFNVINIINNALLWTMTILANNAANVTYVISASFQFYCTVCMCITWIKLYRAQKTNKKIKGEKVYEKFE